MIMRTWRGCTAESDADAYHAYLERTGVSQFKRTPGNRGVYILRRLVHGRAEFLVMSLWDSMEDIQRFTGPDPTRAVFFPEDEEFLVEYDVVVRHYDVLTAPLLPTTGA
jgi:heme-degrading monooxygenase HmoA